MSFLPSRYSRPASVSPAVAGLVISAGLVVLGTPAAPSAASPSPTSCNRLINGVKWTLDPCIADGDPVPPDFQDAIDDLAACQILLNAGTDKIVWMLYFDINPAEVDLSNLGYAAAKSYLPNWIGQWLPNGVASMHVPIVEAEFAGDVTKMTTDLNNEIKAGIPNNPKVKAMDPPALGAADIQDTALGGCPHPNDRGHQKIADKLKTTYDGM